MAKQYGGNSGDRARTFDSQIMPRLEINIPMPPGAAIPARSPQPAPVEPSQPAKPAAAQSS